MTANVRHAELALSAMRQTHLLAQPDDLEAAFQRPTPMVVSADVPDTTEDSTMFAIHRTTMFVGRAPGLAIYESNQAIPTYNL